MNGARDAGVVCRQDDAALCMRALQFSNVLSKRPAKATIVFAAGTSRDRKGIGGLARHAELAGSQLAGDVFAGFSGECELEIMDCGRAIENNRADNSLLDPVDQVRPAARLDHMTANGSDDGASILM